MAVDFVLRFYFEWPRDRALDTQLQAVTAGDHLLVTAFALPEGKVKWWPQGILELSREEVVFYRIRPGPRPVARWESGAWQTKRRRPAKDDTAFLRFGWPRMTVIECARDGTGFALAAPNMYLSLIEGVLWDHSDLRGPPASRGD